MAGTEGGGTNPLAWAVIGGSVVIAGALLINDCARRNASARNADATRIMQAINTDPIQAAKNLRFLITAEVVSTKQVRDKLSATLPMIQYRHGPAMTAEIPGTECKLPSDARAGLKTDWLNIECAYWFPPNDGFAGKPKDETIAAGKVIDRYGSPFGTFLSPDGISYAQRALPYDQSKKAYHRYEVLKPLSASTGPIAAWFDEPGGGIQYKISKPVQQLIDDGTLKEAAKP